MLLRTHLAFAFLMIILFVKHVNNQWVFILMVLVATVLPDLDTGFSSWGRHWIFRPLQFFVKHRGIFHSLTTATLLSILLAVFWPVGSLGFFIGYSVHIFLDSFTREGVQPFWPLKHKTYGFISTGGRIEDSFFVFLIIFDVALIIITFVF
ncbi:MAG: metal-dependent hydrolase [Candidatus Nanoarchaeia archaeon]|nr:metal-dependent hydrolase [Candidatus Nanoarchaeia archaeon]MDD5741177.1 metal-dependent hydrolase [Candidatus Nanoarchaeia archaeon]